MNIEWIDEQKDLRGTTVLVRAGLNAPVDNGIVVNDFRIRKALPTLRFLKDEGARVIVIAHVGREVDETLRPIADVLSAHLPITFQTRESFDASRLQNGEIVLLENIRQDTREIENDEVFAQELASLADIFVQDAFSVSHREHASIVGIPKYLKSYGGLLLKKEIEKLTEVLEPEHPALFVLGGAKFETKEPLIRKFIATYDTIFIGGALQNELLAAKGYAVGKSVVEDGHVPVDILESDVLHTVVDVVVERDSGVHSTVSVEDINESDVIVDIGEASIGSLSKEIGKYKTIVWNGPLGWYEKGYSGATVKLAHAAVKSLAKTFVGGGDTVAIIQEEGLENDFDFVSTGGGAMLTFLLDKTTAGITALEK